MQATAQPSLMIGARISPSRDDNLTSVRSRTVPLRGWSVAENDPGKFESFADQSGFHYS